MVLYKDQMTVDNIYLYYNIKKANLYIDSTKNILYDCTAGHMILVYIILWYNDHNAVVIIYTTLQYKEKCRISRKLVFAEKTHILRTTWILKSKMCFKKGKNKIKSWYNYNNKKFSQ